MTKKTDAELAKLLVDSRKELREVRFAAAGARAKDSDSAKKLRATIARTLTELHARTTKADSTGSLQAA